MDLYACGFNAHNQLSPNPTPSPQDLLTFHKIISAKQSISIHLAALDFTLLEVDNALVALGLPPPTLLPALSPRLITAASTDNTRYTTLTLRTRPHILLHDATLPRPSPNYSPSTPSLAEPSLAALSGAGTLCTIDTPHPGHHFIQQSPSPLHLYAHCTSRAPLLPDLPPWRPAQLVASEETFTLLTSLGTVHTWGSARHGALGRAVSPASPAAVPGLLDFLGGVPVRKVAAGGWVGAAVSRDRDLYLWGGRMGDGERIRGLGRGEEGVLVDIEGGVDVVDVGVGMGHVVALDGRGRVWAVGRGANGQLGTGGRVFEEDWVEVRGLVLGEGMRVKSVACGPYSSFLVVGGKD
ncbi:MAG: hypothetical protein M1829_006783 [Trizodia sp. TS-e1964]|nr:MAG: hypothetical protein M1829_006783 [Trizodia sp. TS-e1964]